MTRLTVQEQLMNCGSAKDGGHLTPKFKNQQAAFGLGIITNQPIVSAALATPQLTSNTKNSLFFDIVQTSDIKPPPALSEEARELARINQKKRALQSFADRIQSSVSESRKNAEVTTVSRVTPILEDFNATLSKEEIVPLPSPALPLLERKSKPTLHQMLSPENLDSSLPLISMSPHFTFPLNNVIPSLQEDPLLGDIEIVREQKCPSPELEDSVDKSLRGKHIWKYRMKHVLGVGAFSTVYLAEDLEEGGFFAIKTINKERMRKDDRLRSSVEREVHILKLLNHDKIVKLEATMESEQYLCIVLEYVRGQELFNFSIDMHDKLFRLKSRAVDEAVIKKLVRELMEVIIWLHDHNIVHRDIKLENILVYFDPKTNEPHIKIADFGLSRVIDRKNPCLKHRCGSIIYTAPEIILGLPYDGRLSDIWSVGVVFYTLLTGTQPFNYSPLKGETLSTLHHRIVEAHVKWPTCYNISTEAKQVVHGMLIRRPEQRISLQEALSLPWFSKV